MMRSLFEAADSEIRIPALFVGHGSPMNAIEDNEFSRFWTELGKSLPRLKAILCISAHWETDGTKVTAQEQPRTIHDFYNFPEPLYQVRYPAPGSPELAQLATQTVRTTPVGLDYDWGLDHGAWSVLCRMISHADVPVVQLSLDRSKAPRAHYEIGKELKALRNKGVLILGSGNVVHNLREVVWEDSGYDWAREFDEKVRDLILAGDHEAVIEYTKLGRAANLSVPTNEHYLPLLYTLAVQDRDEAAVFFAEKVTLGSISMRSLRLG